MAADLVDDPTRQYLGVEGASVTKVLSVISEILENS
jgi:hypothetical protein